MGAGVVLGLVGVCVCWTGGGPACLPDGPGLTLGLGGEM